MKISVAQALLILIDYKSKFLAKQLEEKELNLQLIDNLKLQLTTLKKLYLVGAKDDESRVAIVDYLKDPILQEFEISADPEIIDNDSSRRYFETHLAYETLANHLDKLSTEELEKHLQLVKKTAPDYYSDLYDTVLGVQSHSFGDNTEREYGYYLKKLKDNEIFSDFSEESREKLIALVSSAFVAMVIADSNPKLLPLDIYGEGIYLPEERGKKVRNVNKNTPTSALGLLKTTMPIPREDEALMKKTQTFLKPSDQATYNADATWVKDNFSRLVHPFSNSISGTLLCQLRAMLKIKDTASVQGQSIYLSGDKMKTFLTVFISALLFNSGGHSLHEFVSPLELDKVKNAFTAINGFDSFDLEGLFLANNEIAFDEALKKTIEYNNQILKRAAVHGEIKQQKQSFNEQSLRAAISESPFDQDLKSNFLQQVNSNVENAKTCFDLADKLHSLIAVNKARVSGEYFSVYRQGASRHQFLEKNLIEVIRELSHGNLPVAEKLIQSTVDGLGKFKSHSLFGSQIPELGALVSIQMRLRTVIDTDHQMEIGQLSPSQVHTKALE